MRRISWAEFAKDDVSKIRGKANRSITKKTLERFGEICKPGSPKRVTFAMGETFVTKLLEEDLGPHTINKCLNHLRAALNRGKKRGFLAVNPIDASLRLATEDKPPRIITEAEEVALLNAAQRVGGFSWWAFIHVALNTGGRNYSELKRLTWDRVNLDGDDTCVHFAVTKGHCDRIIPIHAETVAVLRRLKVQTLKAGGPFVGLHLQFKWNRIKKAARLEELNMHDMRRTFTARLIRANVPLPTVQKLAGHKNIQTTLRYYNWVSRDDQRQAIEKLRKTSAAG